MIGLLILALVGLVPVFLIAVLLQWACFGRYVEVSEFGIGLSVGCAVILAIIGYGVINADDGPWNPFPGGIAFLLSGAAVLLFLLRTLRRYEETPEDHSDLRDTFE